MQRGVYLVYEEEFLSSTCLNLIKVKLYLTSVMVYWITVLLLIAVQISKLSAEWKIKYFRKVIQNAVLDLSDQQELIADKTDIILL